MVEGYVLSPFSDEEMIHLPHLLQNAGEAVVDIISSGIQAAMERHHGKEYSKLTKED
jgi:peptidyl-tRNA hydrolase